MSPFIGPGGSGDGSPAGDEAAPLLQAQGLPGVSDFTLHMGQLRVLCLPGPPQRAQALRWLALQQPPPQGRLWVDGSAAWGGGPAAADGPAVWARRVAALAGSPAQACAQLQQRTPAQGPALFIADASGWVDTPAAAELLGLCAQLRQQQVGFVFLVAQAAQATRLEGLARAAAGMAPGGPDGPAHG